MSLHAALTRVRTEEDVKDAYIEALGLKGVNKGLIDIQTPEIWFEAKEAPTPPLLMFAQLLVYVRAARKRGEAIPGFQVRRALEAFGDTQFTDFAPFKAAYADLSEKLRPQVFELGFLPS